MIHVRNYGDVSDMFHVAPSRRAAHYACLRRENKKLQQQIGWISVATNPRGFIIRT